MEKSSSIRVLATPSAYAKKHYLYVQEAGTLKSITPHISKRANLTSFLFIIILSGRGTIHYKDALYTVKAGDCIWLDCRAPYSHESSVDDPWELQWVHYNGNTAKDYYENYREQDFPIVFTPRNLNHFTDTITNIYDVHKAAHSNTELLSHKYLTDLITFCYVENQEDIDLSESTEAKVKQVSDYIDQHFSEKITLEDLADIFYISKFHLSREFKKQYGITIGNALTAKRLSHAKSQLRFSDSSIEQVSTDCGFSDVGYFIKVFKSYEGQTPLEFRRSWRTGTT